MLTRSRAVLAAAFGAACLAGAAEAPARVLQLPLRSRVELFRGSDEWQEVRTTREFPVKETALLICDMWDRHWCKALERRADLLVKAMNPVVAAARAAGIQIIHAPSDTMAFYQDAPQRRRVLAIVKIPAPPLRELPDPPLPIDDKVSCCESHDDNYMAWTRQHPGLTIGPQDIISDRGDEIYSFMRLQGIRNLLIMGVHTNMCILNRSFAIKRMTRMGVRSVLVRDLTDAAYDPAQRPFVSHEEGTELVVQHIEKHWCPSILSKDLVARLGAE